MGEFFEKLRKDKQQAGSRNLCDSIETPRMRDALRVQLSLYYAGVDNHDGIASTIIQTGQQSPPAYSEGRADASSGSAEA